MLFLKSASLQYDLSTHWRESILSEVEGFKDPIRGEKVGVNSHLTDCGAMYHCARWYINGTNLFLCCQEGT